MRRYALFSLGKVVATQGVLRLFARKAVDLSELLDRHLEGDFGVISPEDWIANRRALRRKERIFSAYMVDDQKIWIITEADRSSTCILLPSEY